MEVSIPAAKRRGVSVQANAREAGVTPESKVSLPGTATIPEGARGIVAFARGLRPGRHANA